MATEPVPSRLIPLPERGLLRIAGADRVTWLQGLVTNDVTAVDAATSIYAALLTPQGRILHDFFIAAPAADPEALWLEVEAARRDDLVARLGRYRLRAKVGFDDLTASHEVLALLGNLGTAAAALGLAGTPGASAPMAGVGVAGGMAMVDPRLAALGLRLLVPRGARAVVEAATGAVPADHDAADRARLALGVPDASHDLEPERALPLEHNLDLLNAISWTKGCYIGQELTARMRYRGLVRRRLRLVRVDGPLPPPGTPIRCGDQDAGELRSGRDGLALALLRLELPAEPRPPLQAGDAILTPLDPKGALNPDRAAG